MIVILLSPSLPSYKTVCSTLNANDKQHSMHVRMLHGKRGPGMRSCKVTAHQLHINDKNLPPRQRFCSANSQLISHSRHDGRGQLSLRYLPLPASLPQLTV